MLRRCVLPKRADSSSFADRRFHFGATENAGVENAGVDSRGGNAGVSRMERQLEIILRQP